MRYFGLTPAQYFALAIFAAGVWLLFIRKPKDNDTAYAKDSVRIAKLREKKKREAEDAADTGSPQSALQTIEATDAHFDDLDV